MGKGFTVKCTDKTHNDIGLCGHRELASEIAEEADPELDGEEYYDAEDKWTTFLAQFESSVFAGSGVESKPRATQLKKLQKNISDGFRTHGITGIQMGSKKFKLVKGGMKEVKPKKGPLTEDELIQRDFDEDERGGY